MKGDMNTPPIRQLNYAQHYFCPNITGVGLLSISYRRTERTISPRFAAGTAPSQSLKSCIIRPNNHVNVRKNGTSRQTNRQTDGQTKVLYFPLWRCQRNNVHWKNNSFFHVFFVASVYDRSSWRLRGCCCCWSYLVRALTVSQRLMMKKLVMAVTCWRRYRQTLQECWTTNSNCFKRFRIVIVSSNFERRTFAWNLLDILKHQWTHCVSQPQSYKSFDLFCIHVNWAIFIPVAVLVLLPSLNHIFFVTDHISVIISASFILVILSMYGAEETNLDNKPDYHCHQIRLFVLYMIALVWRPLPIIYAW